jgi:hypothetical protein
MPIVIPGGSPYPTVNDIMNTARARVNDMMNGVEGDLLSNDCTGIADPPYGCVALVPGSMRYGRRADLQEGCNSLRDTCTR